MQAQNLWSHKVARDCWSAGSTKKERQQRRLQTSKRALIKHSKMMHDGIASRRMLDGHFLREE